MKKEIIFVLASGLLMTVHAAHNNNYHTDSFNWNLGSDLVETTMGVIPAAQATLVNAKTIVSEAQVAYDAIDPTDTVALAAAQEALDVANAALTTAQATGHDSANDGHGNEMGSGHGDSSGGSMGGGHGGGHGGGNGGGNGGGGRH